MRGGFWIKVALEGFRAKLSMYYQKGIGNRLLGHASSYYGLFILLVTIKKQWHHLVFNKKHLDTTIVFTKFRISREINLVVPGNVGSLHYRNLVSEGWSLRPTLYFIRICSDVRELRVNRFAWFNGIFLEYRYSPPRSTGSIETLHCRNFGRKYIPCRIFWN